MKKVILLMFVVLLFALLTGCGVSEPELKDVGGDWVGNLGIDSSENKIEISAYNHYDLWIDQNTNSLTASLTLPSEFDIDSPIALSGTVYGNEVSLSGSYNDSEVSVDGIVDEEDSLQIVIKGLGSEIYHVLLFKKEPLLEASLSNSYELLKKLGTSGNGRSVILVHGLHSSAGAWNNMLNYLDDHGISKTNNVWVFQYKWEKHIDSNGAKMLSMIDEKQSDGDISADPIIIAHSMGGLVARSYIAKKGDFYRLMTLGTPHFGSGLARLAWIFSWIVDVDGVTVAGVLDLVPGSDFLEALNSNSYEQSQRSKYKLVTGKVDWHFVCTHHILGVCSWGKYEWYGNYPTEIKLGHEALSSPNDGMVSESSAGFDTGIHYTFPWLSHFQLTGNDRVKESVSDFIKNNQ